MADDIKVWHHSLQPERVDKPILLDLRKGFLNILGKGREDYGKYYIVIADCCCSASAFS